MRTLRAVDDRLQLQGLAEILGDGSANVVLVHAKQRGSETLHFHSRRIGRILPLYRARAVATGCGRRSGSGA